MHTPPSINNLLYKLANAQVQEAEILCQLEKARRIDYEDKEIDSLVPDNTFPIFCVTDRVIATNGAHVSKGKPVTQDNQQAMVATTTKYRVYFIINNGTTTWRLVSNLFKMLPSRGLESDRTSDGTAR